MSAVRLALETGKVWVFATALDWPGWARRGRDEESAIEALDALAARYKAAMGSPARSLRVRGLEFTVAARVRGSSATDFGVPEASTTLEDDPLSAAQARSWTAMLRASWRAFDEAAHRARGVALRTGPRGGGRDLARMRVHLLESDVAYLRRIGGAYALTGRTDADREEVRAATLEALDARRRGELPDRGPRGGMRWSQKVAIRRSAWHALDHAWEIEDRSNARP